MEKSQSITELAKAVISVMKEVKGIEKNMTVGSGNNAYSGVSDKDVKTLIGKAMEKNGLCIVPTSVTPSLQIDRWEQEEFYNGKSNGIKQKQSVFTTVDTRYLLMHESGEFIEISGYGHGVDAQDKGAGKATTYALKNALLYTFMVPTGKIDDAETTHSDEIETPKSHPKKVKLSDIGFQKLLNRIALGEVSAFDTAKEMFDLMPDQILQAEKIIKNLPPVTHLKTA